MARGDRQGLPGTDASSDLLRSFEQDYRASFSLVYNYVLRRLSDNDATEDVVAEAYLNAARYYDRFDPTRAKFSTWVISIARNCISDYFAHETPQIHLSKVPENLYGVEDSYDEHLANRDLVMRLLSSLDASERELVLLKYYEGKRNVQIAEELGLNSSTVSTRLARALAKMRTTVS